MPAPNMPIIDAHMHLWDFSRHYHAWLQDDPAAPGLAGDLTPIAQRSYLPQDYRDDTSGLEVIGCVYVETGLPPEVQTDESLWAHQLAASGLPSAVVAGVRLELPSAADTLAAHALHPSVRGVRQILNWHPDPLKTYTDRDLLQDPAWREGFALLARHDLSFDLQIYPGQMAEAARLAARHPETTFILNHAGMPVDRDEEGLWAWREGLSALAARPNVFAKISGLGMLDHGWTTEGLRPFVRGVIEAFGPERAMFASNFPVDRLYSSFERLYGAFAEIVGDLSRDEQERLFARTAAAVYRLDL